MPVLNNVEADAAGSGDSSVRMVHSGVDTLTCTNRYMLCASVLETLKAAKAQALEAGHAVPVQVGGYQFMLQRHGARHGFDLVFTNRHLEVVARSKRVDARVATMPNVMVTLRSEWLNVEDWTCAWQTLQDFGEKVLEKGWQENQAGDDSGDEDSRQHWGDETWQISRVDVFADFQGWEPTRNDLDNWATQPGLTQIAYLKSRGRVGTVGFQKGGDDAQKKLNRKRSRAEDVAEHERLLSTDQFGKGSIVFRCYDKSAEILVTRKGWFRDIWKKCEGYDAEKPVWRAEFQLRRPALKTIRHPCAPMGVLTVPELAECYGDLWRYLCGASNNGRRGWISLRKKTYAKRGKRRLLKKVEHWDHHPAWVAIRNFALEEYPITRTKTRLLRSVEALKPGFTGYGSSVAAMTLLAETGDVSALEAELRESPLMRASYARKLTAKLEDFWREHLHGELADESPSVVADALHRLWAKAGALIDGSSERQQRWDEAALRVMGERSDYQQAGPRECFKAYLIRNCERYAESGHLGKERAKMRFALRRLCVTMLRNQTLSLAAFQAHWSLFAAGIEAKLERKTQYARGLDVVEEDASNPADDPTKSKQITSLFE